MKIKTDSKYNFDKTYYYSSDYIEEEPRKCFLSNIKINIEEERKPNISYFFVNELNKFVNSPIYENINDCINKQNGVYNPVYF